MIGDTRVNIRPIDNNNNDDDWFNRFFDFGRSGNRKKRERKVGWGLGGLLDMDPFIAIFIV